MEATASEAAVSEISAGEAAARLGVSRIYVATLARKGLLVCRREGGRRELRIEAGAVEALAAERAAGTQRPARAVEPAVEPDGLTVTDAAHRLGVSAGQVRIYCRQGALAYRRLTVHGVLKFCISPADLEAFALRLQLQAREKAEHARLWKLQKIRDRAERLRTKKERHALAMVERQRGFSVGKQRFRRPWTAPIPLQRVQSFEEPNERANVKTLAMMTKAEIKALERAYGVKVKPRWREGLCRSCGQPTGQEHRFHCPERPRGEAPAMTWNERHEAER